MFGWRGSKACFVHQDDMFIVWVTFEQNRRWTGLTLCEVTIYLLIHDDIHLDTVLSPAFKDSIEAVFLIKFAWSPEIQLWRKPPVLGVGS